MTTSNHPTAVRQLSLRAPLHGKKSSKRKMNQSDTEELSRRGVVTLLLCRLALQRPPDKNRARDTLPKTSRVHASSCSGLLLLMTGGKTVWEGDPTLPMQLVQAANPGRARASTLTSRKARTGTEPSPLNRWPRAQNLSCQRLKPEAERKNERLVQAGTLGQAGALGSKWPG